MIVIVLQEPDVSIATVAFARSTAKQTQTAEGDTNAKMFEDAAARVTKGFVLGIEPVEGP